MPRHRVDLGLGGISYSVDGQFVDATGFPLWQRDLPRGLHLESRAGGSRHNNRQFVRTPGCGVSVEWTSRRDRQDAAPRRDEGPPPRQPRGPPPRHQRGLPSADVRAHHARQRRAQYPERRRGEQRAQDRGPDAEDARLFDVSEYDSDDDDENGNEGSRASLRQDDYGFAHDPRWHGYNFESEEATRASDLECDYYPSSAHDARSRARPRRDDRRAAHDPQFLGFRVQLRQPSRGRGY